MTTMNRGRVKANASVESFCEFGLSTRPSGSLALIKGRERCQRRGVKVMDKDLPMEMRRESGLVICKRTIAKVVLASSLVEGTSYELMIEDG